MMVMMMTTRTKTINNKDHRNRSSPLWRGGEEGEEVWGFGDGFTEHDDDGNDDDDDDDDDDDER